MVRMLLICAACGRHWSLTGSDKRRATCPKCHRRRVTAGRKRAWRVRKLLGARTEARPEEATTPLPSLKELMDAADAASERAFEAARSIAARIKPGR